MIVIGDSHAVSLLGSIADVVSGKKVLNWAKNGCPTISNIKTKAKDASGCSDF